MGLIEYLFFRPGPVGPVFQQWGNILLGAFLGIALSLLVLGGLLRIFSARHALHARIARRVIVYGLALQSVGVVVLWLRWLDFPFISMRLWLFLLLAAQAVAGGYLWWWLQNRYPDQLAEYEWDERKRSYLPRAAGGGAPPVRRKAVAAGRRK